LSLKQLKHRNCTQWINVNGITMPSTRSSSLRARKGQRSRGRDTDWRTEEADHNDGSGLNLKIKIPSQTNDDNNNSYNNNKDKRGRTNNNRTRNQRSRDYDNEEGGRGGGEVDPQTNFKKIKRTRSRSRSRSRSPKLSNSSPTALNTVEQQTMRAQLEGTLTNAVMKGDFSGFFKLLEKEEFPLDVLMDRDPAGATVLHWACLLNHQPGSLAIANKIIEEYPERCSDMYIGPLYEG
jgi:hypothetical protein